MSYAVRNDGLGWRSVNSADDCAANETYFDVIPRPAAPTLDQLKANKLADMNAHCSGLLDAIKAGYPDGEVQSWSKQEAEARSYAVDNSVATLLLSALASAREVPLSVLVERVIEKADAFAIASGEIIGRRQRCEDLIAVADDATELEAIDWPVLGDSAA